MRNRNGADAGDLTIAGPLSDGVMCGDTIDIAQSPPAPQPPNWRQERDAALQTLAALAELFPRCFTADRWKPHRPLARGIHRELVERGILQPEECRLVIGLYVARPMYQRAVAAGGARVNLAGNPTDEVTADEMAYAAASVARAEARAIAKTEAARTARQAAYRERQRAKQAPAPAPSGNTTRRDGLAELRAAAAARRNGGVS